MSMKSPASLVVAVALAFQLPAVVNADCTGCRTDFGCICPNDPFGCQNLYGCDSGTGCYNCCNSDPSSSTHGGNQGSLMSGACVCNSGFSGDQCSYLDIGPSPPTPTPANCGTSCTGCTSCSACWAESPCYWHPDAETKCQAQSSSYRCSDPVTTPEPTSPLTSAPTTPSRCTEANTCEVESSSECKTCYTGSSSNSLCESYNVNYESWYCTWCDCSTGPSSPATPAPAPSLPSGTFTADCTSTTTSCSKQTIAFGTGLQWDVSEPVTMTMEIDQCTITFHYDVEAVEPDQVTLTENSACSVSGPSTCFCSDAGVGLATFSLSGDGTSLSITETTNGVTTLWNKDADNGGGSSFPFIYVGAAVAGVVVVILIFASVCWFRSRKIEIEGVDSAPLVENDQMNIESSEPYHEFSGDETTC